MYTVIKSDNLDCLCGKVSAAMKENWNPHGGVSATLVKESYYSATLGNVPDQFMYSQAMVRGES